MNLHWTTVSSQRFVLFCKSVCSCSNSCQHYWQLNCLLHLMQSYDGTTHFESTVTDVLNMYTMITGKVKVEIVLCYCASPYILIALFFLLPLRDVIRFGMVSFLYVSKYLVQFITHLQYRTIFFYLYDELFFHHKCHVSSLLLLFLVFF